MCLETPKWLSEHCLLAIFSSWTMVNSKEKQNLCSYDGFIPMPSSLNQEENVILLRLTWRTSCFPADKNSQQIFVFLLCFCDTWTKKIPPKQQPSVLPSDKPWFILVLLTNLVYLSSRINNWLLFRGNHFNSINSEQTTCVRIFKLLIRFSFLPSMPLLILGKRINSVVYQKNQSILLTLKG